MATPRSVAFHTLGCKLNFSETSSIRRMFEDKAYQVNDFEDGADVFVINTCSVTEFADRKCKKLVRSALKASPDAKVVVVGCYAQLKPKEIAEIPGVNLILGAKEKFNIIHYIDKITAMPNDTFINVGEIDEVAEFEDSFSFGDRTRSFLKIQDGCDYKCTFCTIPQARGRSRSDTMEHVIQNAKNIAVQGVKEIVLTGVNIGDFGNGTSVIEGVKPKKEDLFIDLIKALDELNDIQRFRISSIEPNLITDEIIEFVAKAKRFVPHFHIPLQSGSDKILRLMKRRYKRSLYHSKVTKIKSIMPHACIGVDVIVGFPGESEEDFMDTYDFVKSMDVSYLHVFTYSERANTPAAIMDGRVPIEERRRRNKMLRILSDRKKMQFYEDYLGTNRSVLFEASKKPKMMSGYTDNYLRIETNLVPELLNKTGLVQLNSIMDSGLIDVSIV